MKMLIQKRIREEKDGNNYQGNHDNNRKRGKSLSAYRNRWKVLNN